MVSQTRGSPRIAKMTVSAYEIPTDAPESDGTIEWNATSMLLVELEGGGHRGLGYSYASASAAGVAHHTLRGIVEGADPMNVGAVHEAMVAAVRNIGSRGVAANAISAIDIALWDLKARILGVPLYRLLGAARDAVPAYGSGGFTSYTLRQLSDQLGGWVRDGMSMVKMKIGRNPSDDLARVRAARDAIGRDPQLFVDANGAYSVKQALAFAEPFVDLGVFWFEEPVSSDDIEGLRMVRAHAPAPIEIAAGEYGYDAFHFRGLLEGGAVDVLQADATRCRGVTGFLQTIALCESHARPLSAHTAPSIHAHVCCASSRVRHIEYFHDHARIEHMLMDGALAPERGMLRPDPDRPGLGLTFKHRDAERYVAR